VRFGTIASLKEVTFKYNLGGGVSDTFPPVTVDDTDSDTTVTGYTDTGITWDNVRAIEVGLVSDNQVTTAQVIFLAVEIWVRVYNLKSTRGTREPRDRYFGTRRTSRGSRGGR
jgi:hypothetical protein